MNSNTLNFRQNNFVPGVSRYSPLAWLNPKRIKHPKEKPVSNIKDFIFQQDDTLQHIPSEEYQIISPTQVLEVQGKTYAIPNNLNHILQSIKDSKSILSLEENWDDEGALPVPLHIWQSGVMFTLEYSMWIKSNRDVVIDAPEISACGDGSIDLTWRTPNARFLINFKNQEDIEAVYYGDQYNNKNGIKGTIDSTTDIQEFLSIWMMKLQK